MNAKPDANFWRCENISKKCYRPRLQRKKGIVFIMNGWGPGDHIDLWDGMKLLGGRPDWFSRGEQIWFWELQ